MTDSLDEARNAALEFFQQTIKPKDRAAFIPFNDRPSLAVKFTNDVNSLAGGLAGLKAERGTALWDSIVFCLYYFNGVRGQRALLLLSDGKDEGSRFTWDHSTFGFGFRACQPPDCLRVEEEDAFEDGCSPERTLPEICVAVVDPVPPLVDTFAPCAGDEP